MAEGMDVLERIKQEELVREKVDEWGNRWEKVYFGGGPHFQNWLDQVLELAGKDNVQVEEANSEGFQCYEQGGEKIYRIWVKEGAIESYEDIL